MSPGDWALMSCISSLHRVSYQLPNQEAPRFSKNRTQVQKTKHTPQQSQNAHKSMRSNVPSDHHKHIHLRPGSLETPSNTEP